MSDLTIDPDRAKWLRALRSLDDPYVLELLDEHNRRLQESTWDECRDAVLATMLGHSGSVDAFREIVPPNPYRSESR